MIELFSDIPLEIRNQISNWIDLALEKLDPVTALKMIVDFANSTENEEERSFIDFYFNLKMEKIKNENNIN